jgi:hypothetical protein
MKSVFEVYQGDLTDYIYVRPGPLNAGDPIGANWTCQVAVLNNSDAEELAARAVTDKSTVEIENEDGSKTNEECFVCYLLPSETAILSEDTDNNFHTWVIEIKNATTSPPFNLEKHIFLKVNKQGIA